MMAVLLAVLSFNPQVMPEGATVYEAKGYEIALPREWEGKVLIDAEELSGDVLITVHEKESYEQGHADGLDGIGWMFSLTRFNQLQFEEYLAYDSSGTYVFARDENFYYAELGPTDVQYYRSGLVDYSGHDWEDWGRMLEQIADVRQDFIARNGLTPYDASEFFNRDFTYDSEHRYVTFEYGGLMSRTLVLSQPEKQGEGGIWCVERWFDNDYANWYIVFPTESGMTAADYYRMLQTEADSGEEQYLTPEGAALTWVREYYAEAGLDIAPACFQTEPCEPACSIYRSAQQIVEQPGRIEQTERNEPRACPDGMERSLYWVVEQTPWVALEEAPNRTGDAVRYTTEGGDCLEIYPGGIVRIERDGESRVYGPLFQNGERNVYQAAMNWSEE